MGAVSREVKSVRRESKETVSDESAEVRGPKCNLLEDLDHDQRQHRPKKRRAPRPARNQQEPAVDWRVPERQHDQTVEQHQPILKNGMISPGRSPGSSRGSRRTTLVSKTMISCTQTTIAKLISGRTTSGMMTLERTVVRSDTGSDFQKRMLRSRRSPCSGVETIKHADDEHGEDHHHGRDVVRLLDWHAVLSGRASSTARLRLRQANRAEGEPNHLDAGDNQRRYINGAVLPKLAPDRPVERPRWQRLRG